MSTKYEEEKSSLLQDEHESEPEHETENENEERLKQDKGQAPDDEGEDGQPIEQDERFNPPPPSPWKRLALILLICALFYFGFHMRAALLREKKPKVIYATRYSKEHKFRPAASPIITETLKDGRVRIRGAEPTPTYTPSSSSTPTARKRRRSQAGKASGKTKRRRGASGPVGAKQ